MPKEREAGHTLPRNWWPELATHCPNRIEPEIERRPVNGLNIEIGSPQPRCSHRSPDGRGLAWLVSGGSVLAYGCCEQRQCPRVGGQVEDSDD